MGSSVQAVPGGPPPVVINPLVGLLPPELLSLEKDLYLWEFDRLPLAAGGVFPITNKLTTEKHLFLLGAMAEVTDAADTALVAFFPGTVTMTDGSDRRLMNAAVPFSTFFGTGQLPAIWPWRKFIPAGSQVVLEITSRDALARNIRATLIGIAAYTSP